MIIDEINAYKNKNGSYNVEVYSSDFEKFKITMPDASVDFTLETNGVSDCVLEITMRGTIGK